MKTYLKRSEMIHSDKYFGIANKFLALILILFVLNVFIAFPFDVGAQQYQTQQSPLLSDVDQADDCTTDFQKFNEDIMVYGRIAAVSKAYEDCLRKKITEKYKKCKGDPWYDGSLETQIQKALAISRTDNPVHINCTGGGGNASTYIGSYDHPNEESFWWGGWFSSVYNQLGKTVCGPAQTPNNNNCRYAPYPWPYSQAAGIVWHEVMHTHGYTHGANSQGPAKINCGYENDANWHYQVNTMPYIIGQCIDEVIERSGDKCGNIKNCPGGNQLKIITGFDSSTCKCINDPGRKGLGILALKSGQLIDKAILPAEDWVSGWHYGSSNTIQAAGDFNGDSRDDFIVTSNWGIGIITHDGTSWRQLLCKPNGTSFGGWNFQSKDNKIAGIGDFNGDGKDDIVITSDWGIGILRLYGSTLRALMIKPRDTWFGRWRYDARVNRGRDKIEGIGDFNNDNKADILIKSSWGIGILTLRSSSLYALMAKPANTWFGAWRYNAGVNTGNDKLEDIGDFNGDGKDDVLITSSWGIGILTLSGSSMTSMVAKPRNTWFGSWRYNASVNRGNDRILAVADLNGDGKDEILISSSWGIGLLALRGSSFVSLVAKPNGTRFGSWSYQSSSNDLVGTGDFDGNGKDDFILKSPWGVGVLKLYGSTFRHMDMGPYGSLFGSWLIQITDRIKQTGNFSLGGGIEMLVQK